MDDEPKFRQALRNADRHATAVRAARALRRLAPGADRVPSLGEGGASDRVARLIEQAAGDRPSVTRELGLTAVQIWQSFSRPGVGGGEVAILFTDLVGFSSWALKAGDEAVLELLREVGDATGAVIARRGGKVVKSLGDGVMAVFADTASGIDAAAEACTAVSAITLDGYRPQLRAGLHTGRPKRVGRDYLGVDVNVAARVADAAGAGEVLVSGPALSTVDTERFSVRRRRGFRAKGTPKDLTVYSVVPRS